MLGLGRARAEIEASSAPTPATPVAVGPGRLRLLVATQAANTRAGRRDRRAHGEGGVLAMLRSIISSSRVAWRWVRVSTRNAPSRSRRRSQHARRCTRIQRSAACSAVGRDAAGAHAAHLLRTAPARSPPAPRDAGDPPFRQGRRAGSSERRSPRPGPWLSRSTMMRRVGSASAWKARDRGAPDS